MTQKLPLETRLGTVQDAETLHHIIQAAYRTEKSWTNEFHLVKNERISLEELKSQLLHPKDPILVGEVVLEGNKRQIVGCIQTEPSHEHPDWHLKPKSVLIGLFSVDPAFQSQGIGKRLMMAAIDYSKRTWQSELAVMWVINKREDIQKWYERLGFEWKGERREFIMPDNLKVEDVWFKVYEKSIE